MLLQEVRQAAAYLLAELVAGMEDEKVTTHSTQSCTHSLTEIYSHRASTSTAIRQSLCQQWLSSSCLLSALCYLMALAWRGMV